MLLVGHLTYKIVSKMTHNVSTGMLNATVSIHIVAKIYLPKNMKS